MITRNNVSVPRLLAEIVAWQQLHLLKLLRNEKVTANVAFRYLKLSICCSRGRFVKVTSGGV